MHVYKYKGERAYRESEIKKVVVGAALFVALLSNDTPIIYCLPFNLRQSIALTLCVRRLPRRRKHPANGTANGTVIGTSSRTASRTAIGIAVGIAVGISSQTVSRTAKEPKISRE